MPDNNKLSVRVRMYRQGLGDCFLLTFQRDGKPDFNMMIDCGLFLGTERGKVIMEAVATDIKTTTQNRIDVVALTHEHWDHISGFALAKDIFQDPDFKFGEVWVGWTENPNDPKFNEVRQRFEKKKKGLRVALNEMKSDEAKPLKKTIDALVNEFFGEGEDEENVLGMSGADAWKYVLEKSEAQPPKYCSPEDDIHTLGDVEGVRVYILGPPEDFELLDDEETPEAETYRKHLRMAVTNGFLAAATGSDNSDYDANAYMPFDPKYKIAWDKAENHQNYSEFFRNNYGFVEKSPDSWRRINEDWLSMASELALNIDGITNNTCLAFAIELVESKKVLIFPGDAQFGNWISWQKLKWEVLENGVKKEVNVNDLLKRTVFYKVGHHGSHNATLKKSGLELMESPELVAMIPTDEKFAANKKTSKTPDGWKMPEKELLERLEQKARGRVIKADEYGGAASDKQPFRNRCQRLNLPATEMENFLAKVTFGGSFVRTADGTPEPLYVQYTING